MMVIIETIPPTEPPTEETDPLAGIIGGSVAGAVLVSAAIAAIMILFILKCVTRRSVYIIINYTYACTRLIQFNGHMGCFMTGIIIIIQ